MRESRTYGSGRGACDETHVPTATASEVADLMAAPMAIATVFLHACKVGLEGSRHSLGRFAQRVRAPPPKGH
jgi:hypothetical protein